MQFQSIVQPFLNEDEFQKASKRLLDVILAPEVIAFHVPNGGERDARVGAKLKAMGTLAGVLDWTFILPGARLYYIELKQPNKTLNPAQRAFTKRLTANSVPWTVAYSLPEIEMALHRWHIPLRGRLAA